jgi:polysaccharide export outer membrane protein
MAVALLCSLSEFLIMFAWTTAALLVLSLVGSDQRYADPRKAAPVATAMEAAPPDYTIGAGDVLSVMFWRDKELSADVLVRPDGRISLPLLSDIDAAGLTPEQLCERIIQRARRFVADASATVVVKEINSRNVYITGNVEKPGTYTLRARLSVLQLIALAGGLKEFINGKNIVVLRHENGRQVRLRFNYEDVVRGRKLEQNVELKPGDTVVVP